MPEISEVSEASAASAEPAQAAGPVDTGTGGKRKILTAFAQLGLMRIAVSCSGLVRNKVLAAVLKPAGFGEFTQLLTIAETVNVFVQFGTLVSMSRNAAAAPDSKEQQKLLETANFLTVCLALGTLTLIVPLLLSPTGSVLLAKLGLQPGLREKVILIALFSLAPIEALRVNYLSFLSGLLDIKGISSKRSLAVIVATIVSIPLVIVFGIAGACIQAALASLFLAYLLGLRCKQLHFRPLAFAWHKHAAMLLATIGTASLISGFVTNATNTLIRAYLISHWGEAENGLYQAAFSLSSQVPTLILTSIGTYAVGTLSQTRDPKALTARIDELLRVIFPMVTVSLGLVGLFSRPLFWILFSSQFHAGAKYFPLLLSSSYMQAAACVVSAPLLGCGLIRTWTAIQIIGALLSYGFAIMFAPAFGIYAIPGGLLATTLFDLAASTAVCKLSIGIVFKWQTGVTLLVGGAAVLMAARIGCSGAGWGLCLSSSVVLGAIGAAMVWRESSAAFRGFLSNRSMWMTR